MHVCIYIYKIDFKRQTQMYLRGLITQCIVKRSVMSSIYHAYALVVFVQRSSLLYMLICKLLNHCFYFCLYLVRQMIIITKPP